MRWLVGMITLAAIGVSSMPALAGDVAVRRRRAVRTDVWVNMDPKDYSTDVEFPFGGSHHAVPGVVSINGKPYRCVVHEQRFKERSHFVAHLRTGHGLTDDAISSAVIVDRNEVVYLGE